MTETAYCLRKYLNHHKHLSGRNMDIKVLAGEVSERNKHIFANQSKRDTCYSGRKLS